MNKKLAIGFIIGLLILTTGSIYFILDKKEIDVFESFLNSNSKNNILEKQLVGDYIIEGDSVYIDDENVKINITPHTSNSPVIELTSKKYEGNIDIVVGFDTSDVIPTGAYYNPNMTNITRSYKCDYLFNYTLNPKYATCYEEIYTDFFNGTVIHWEGSFESGNIAERTVYWNEQDYVWNDVSDSFTRIDYLLLGYDRWYYTRGFSVEKDKTYSLKLDLKTIEFMSGGHKYFFGVKPSGETLREAIKNGHFYYIDPWTNDLSKDLRHYWKLDEKSGQLRDEQGGINFTLEGGSVRRGDAGIINTSVGFTGTTDWFEAVNMGTEFGDTDSSTISMWIYLNASPGSGAADYVNYMGDSTNPSRGFFIFDSNNRISYRPAPTGVSQFSTYSVPINSWFHLAGVYNGTHMNIYINGTSAKNGTDANSIASNPDLVLGWQDSSNSIIGSIDEIGLWNRTLSYDEINDLWGDGTAPILNDTQDSNPTITLNYPQEGQTFDYALIIFNCTVSDDIQLINVSFIIDGVTDYYNDSGVNNSNYIYSKTLADGSHNWTCKAIDSGVNDFTATQRTFAVELAIEKVFEIKNRTSEKITYWISKGDNVFTFMNPHDFQISCSSGRKGLMYYDNSTNQPCFCNGTSWRRFDGDGGC